jgi:hypothetical protein
MTLIIHRDSYYYCRQYTLYGFYGYLMSVIALALLSPKNPCHRHVAVTSCGKLETMNLILRPVA